MPNLGNLQKSNFWLWEMVSNFFSHRAKIKVGTFLKTRFLDHGATNILVKYLIFSVIISSKTFTKRLQPKNLLKFVKLWFSEKLLISCLVVVLTSYEKKRHSQRQSRNAISEFQSGLSDPQILKKLKIITFINEKTTFFVFALKLDN